MTFSIVAVDQKNKELGFAIASCFWNAGQVGYALAEKGAIVSQAQGNWEFIPLFFEKLELNLTLEQIVDVFQSSDEKFENRQVGMVTATGNAFAYSGKKVFNAFQKTGSDYACQGNILVGPQVISDMSEAFEKMEGSLTKKLYAALLAGDNAGGDMRGKISARLRVVKDRGNPLNETITDFTVEEHEEPVREIGRLLELRSNISKAWELLRAVSKAEDNEKEAAVLELDEFLSGKKDRLYLDFHNSLASQYLELGQREKAVEWFKKVIEISPNMAPLISDDLKDDVLQG